MNLGDRNFGVTRGGDIVARSSHSSREGLANHVGDPRGEVTMRRFCAVGIAGLVLLLAAAGCGGSTSPSSPATEAAVEPTTSSSTKPEPLVGDWQTVFQCEELVRVFKSAGLEEFTLLSIAGHDLIPGVDPEHPEQIADPAHPCKGAVPRKHSHSFAEDGTFASYDYNGNQVDDDSYEIVDDHTFILGRITFRYRIEDDTIMFDPVIPADCSTRRCRDKYAYAVSVAFPGNKWKRVD
jgi:hypothetical protein